MHRSSSSRLKARIALAVTMAFETMATTKGYSVTQFFVSAVVASVFVGALAGVASADSKLGVSVNVGANGAALVRGAEVTAVSGTQVDAKTSWGSAVLNWIVKTDAETEYVGKNGKDIARSEITVGDTISFRGSLDQTLSGLVVKAKIVKDWSKTEAKHKLSGTVSSINTSLNSFVVTHGSATTTIETSSSTKFTEDGDNATFADLFVNAKVKIVGLLNASTSIFTATSVEIDEDSSSWSKNDKNEWRNWIRSKIWLKLWNKDRYENDD